MVRRNSNQRITKIKRDIDLDLLEQAELIPVEQGCVVREAGSDLTPYPTISNLRNWVRKYLLKGINGIFISGVKAVPADAYAYSSSSSFYSAVPARKEEYAAGYLKFTTVLDGLIINTQEAKVIECADDFQDDENVPKPGLQLSNFHYLWEQEIWIPEQTDGATSKIAKVFREFAVSTTPNNAAHSFLGTIVPTWLGVGALQDSNNGYSYQWHYWDTDGILAQNNQRTDLFSWPVEVYDCVGDPIYYYTNSKVKWYNNQYNWTNWKTLFTFPLILNNKRYIVNSSNPDNLPSSILFSYVNQCTFSDKLSIQYVSGGDNASLNGELFASPYTKDNCINNTLKCSDGITTKSLSIIHFNNGTW